MARWRGKEYDDSDQLYEMGEIGDYALEPGAIWLIVPDGERREFIRLPYVDGQATPAAWGYVASASGPTLSPSIKVIGKWHGWLRDGELIEA